MMYHHRRASAAKREATWLPRLICRCRDLPDILKFARVAALSVAPATCLYGMAGASSGTAREGDVSIDMGLVSVDQAVMEAEFASEVCADLSQASAIDVSREAGIAWAGPGATVQSLMQSCRDPQTPRCFGRPCSDDVGPGSLLEALLRDPAPLARVQTVSPCGEVRWRSLRGEPERLAVLCAGTPAAGIISRLELRLQPSALFRGPALRPAGPMPGFLR